MTVVFYTNLNAAQPYVRQMESWPAAFGVPRVGERIEFNMTNDKRFDLEVVDVSYRCVFGGTYMARVELHMPSYHTRSITEWTEWFKRHEES